MAKSNLEKSLFWVSSLEGKHIMAEEAWQQEAESSIFNYMQKSRESELEKGVRLESLKAHLQGGASGRGPPPKGSFTSPSNITNWEPIFQTLNLWVTFLTLTPIRFGLLLSHFEPLSYEHNAMKLRKYDRKPGPLTPLHKALLQQRCWWGRK